MTGPWRRSGGDDFQLAPKPQSMNPKDEPNSLRGLALAETLSR